MIDTKTNQELYRETLKRLATSCSIETEMQEILKDIRAEQMALVDRLTELDYNQESIAYLDNFGADL
jgi:anaerobic ribonucleoside-triphosphate reductase